MVSYSSRLRCYTGAVTDTRDDYALFGSSDGSFMVADNYTTTQAMGRVLAFMPKLMLDKQEALINGTSTDVGKPYFGVDGASGANYFYDVNNNKSLAVSPADTVNVILDCRNTYVFMADYTYGRREGVCMAWI